MSIDPTNLSETALLTFSEEFETFDLWDGTSGLDTRPGFAMAKWADSGFVWTGTLNTLYVQPSDQDSTANGTFTVSNGILSIIANETAGSGLASGQSYTSGAITTYHEFSQLYGYFEIRAKVDNAAGTLPAFWLLPSEGIWPPELDVFEVLGSRPGELATTVHSQSAGIIEVGANHFQTANVASVGDLSTAFHSYGVDWQADTITWYLDGQMVFKAPTPADMHGPMYLIANLNVGGAWEGYPTVGNAFSSQLDIDYMRVYSERAQLSSPQDPSRMLTLRVSEDAYEGHAQFIVRVNGQQQGEARTATASHATGEYQDVHLLGDFTNARNVTIEFINDAYGGSATSDRNLYVDSITVNGKVFEAEQAVNGAGPLFGTEANMLSNGVLHFQDVM